MAEQLRGGALKLVAVRGIALGRPPVRTGAAANGRIVRLLVGQSYGYIVTTGREVFFHRSDVRDGTSFNKLVVGDAVTFELVEDRISGARAVRVERLKSHRSQSQ